jgi:hypothetical protein
MNLDLVARPPEHGRAAAGTKESSGIVARLTFDGDRVVCKDRRSAEKRAVMLAAVETVTDADPVWAADCHKPDIAA